MDIEKYPIVLMKNITNAGAVNKNGSLLEYKFDKIMYTKESLQNAFEKYKEKIKSYKIPVCVNPPYLNGRKYTAEEYITVDPKQQVGYVDGSLQEIDEDLSRVVITDTELLRYIPRYEICLRYTTKFVPKYTGTSGSNILVACIQNIICYDLLLKER